DILLPALVAEGLSANDRIKVRMSALQAAAHHAREPERPPTDLSLESRTAGVPPTVIATLIGGAHMIGQDRLAAPDLAKLIKEIQDDAAAMIRAVGAGAPEDGSRADARLQAIRSAGLLDATGEIE
ncbi:hypothetical protein G6O44_25600, partial [Salmonella enterica subsp. enterica serovar Enteritidis]|nr:hypothetical protein [Salmonella enterica subsp. enterica serovar Enteritidis]